MIATNRHRRVDFTPLDQIIDGQTELCPFPISQPANARRQSLKLDSLSRQINPTPKNSIVWKQLQHQFVGNRDIGRLPRERRPAKRAATFAKQRTDIFRHETRKVVCVLYSVLKSEGPNIVAVVESRS